MPKTVIIYAKQQRGMPSLDDQLKEMRAWCKKRRHTIKQEFLEEKADGEVDIGYPGPLLCEAVLQTNCHDLFLFYDESRVLPNPELRFFIREKIGQRGAKIDSCQEGLPYKKQQQIIYDIIQSYRAFRTKASAELSRAKMRMHQRSGRPVNNKPPYGWKTVFKQRQWQIEPDDKEQAMIAEIVERTDNGESLLGVMKDMNARGVRNRSGNKFSYTQFKRIMQNYRASKFPDVDKFAERQKRIHNED